MYRASWLELFDLRSYFGERFGALGEGFIHVHHLRPLHTIGKDYIVDYKKDLIPVCPNCHAMIHRIPNGESMSVDELKSVLMHIKQDKEPSISEEEKVENRTSLVSTSKEVKISPDLKTGVVVKHKVFGEGTIIKIDISQNHISVSFPIGEKSFILPDAFFKGFLQLKE